MRFWKRQKESVLLSTILLNPRQPPNSPTSSLSTAPSSRDHLTLYAQPYSCVAVPIDQCFCKKPDQEKELQQWLETNIRPNNRETYRFGHCHLCNYPIATSRTTLTFTCFECRQEEQFDVRAEVRSLNDKDKNERDDEEEFYRIPIAGERDSDYEETLSDMLGDLSDSENE